MRFGSQEPPLSSGAAVLAAASTILGRTGRTLESTVTGASMGPTLPAGTRIRVSCGAPSPLVPESVVVVAVDDDLLFVHRLVGVSDRDQGAFVVTRGDGSWLCDAPARRDAVVGLVTEYQDGSLWRPIPARRPGAGLAGLVARFHQAAMLAALDVDISLARGLAQLSFRTAAALAALRRRP